MSQNIFLDGFTQRLRNVLQKHEREIEARATPLPGLTPAIVAANTNLDAAIDEFGRFMLDQFKHEPPQPYGEAAD